MSAVVDVKRAGDSLDPSLTGRGGSQLSLVTEFEDFALLRIFGQAGAGLIPVLKTFEKQFRNQDKVRWLGIARDVFGRFCAMSAAASRSYRDL